MTAGQALLMFLMLIGALIIGVLVVPMLF